MLPVHNRAVAAPPPFEPCLPPPRTLGAGGQQRVPPNVWRGRGEIGGRLRLALSWALLTPPRRRRAAFLPPPLRELGLSGKPARRHVVA